MIGQTISATANSSVITATESLGSVQNFVGDAINALIVPQNEKGIAGWEFDIAKQDQIDIEADITDHYMEDNSFLNDHIVRKPIIITVSGSKGELVARRPILAEAILKFLSSSLSVIDAFTGDYTDQSLQKIQQAISEAETYVNQVNQVVEKTKNIVSQFSGESGYGSLQEKAYRELYALFLSNDLLTVLTPWGLFQNMKIIKIPFVQSEDSNSYTDITVTLKEMRFAQTKVTQFDTNLFDLRDIMQKSEVQNNGKAQGSQNTNGMFYNIVHGLH